MDDSTHDLTLVTGTQRELGFDTLKQVAVCLCLIVAVACGGDSSPTAPTPIPTPTPTPAPEPDLVVGSPTVNDSSPAVGATFTLSTTVQNAGDGAAAATTLRYFRSTDATITTDDTAEGSAAVEELSPSVSTSASMQLTAPSTAGTYYYGACVDAVTDESDTANNCSSSVQVTVPAPTPTPTVFGRVLDAESGAGIQGATVIVEDHWSRFSEVGRAVTAADGTYEITGITLAAGPGGATSLTIRAFADSYVSGVHGWGSPGGRFSHDFSLEPAPTCTVVGSVRDQAGRGVAGASVQASTTRPWMQRRTMTGSDGRYAIPELTGSYFLDVIAEGYDDPPTRSVSCRDADQDSLVESDFTLEAGSPNADLDFIGWFWNMIVFNTQDCPPGRCGAPLEQRSSYVLSTSSPDFHIRTHNDGGDRVVSEERVQQIRAEIPRIVATITGQPFGGRISDGSERSNGQITIEFIPPEELGTTLCGEATIGSAQGSVKINSQALSRDEFDSFGQGCPLFPVLRHEMAHALGFFHVVYGGDLMSWLPEYVSDFSPREVHHMQLAYRLGPLQISPYGPLLSHPGAFPPGPGGRPLVTIQCRAPVR